MPTDPPRPSSPPDAPQPPPARADVVIVGSGPAGATWARVLGERAPHLRVVVLEVGPQLSARPGDHVKNIVDDRERLLAQRRSEGPDPHTELDAAAAAGPQRSSRSARPGTFLLERGWQVEGEDGLPAAAMSSNVGGMGAHWTCACPRPSGSERPDLPGGAAVLDELLTAAEGLLGVDASELAAAPLAGVVRATLAGVLDGDRPADRRVQPMPLAVQARPDGHLSWTGPYTILAPVLDGVSGVSLHPEQLVRRVLLRADEGPQDEGSRVTGVEVQDRRTGRVSAIEAPVVVVAGDALRTPQLLHASGVRPRALGRYLNDQPQVITAVRLREDLLERSPAPDPAAATGGVARQSGVSWVPFDDERHPFHGQVMQMDASPVPLAPGATQVPGSFVGLGWFCAKDVREQDRVTFDDDASDPYGMPQPVVHYTLSAVDHDRRQAATAALRTAAAALGTALGEPIPLAPGSSLHYQGTTRMGRVDDGTSVCDTESRVWGVPGLHVAGNGLIATEMACNPTLTSVALAVRGARAVAERWGGVPAGATHHARPEQPA